MDKFNSMDKFMDKKNSKNNDKKFQDGNKKNKQIFKREKFDWRNWDKFLENEV